MHQRLVTLKSSPVALRYASSLWLSPSNRCLSVQLLRNTLDSRALGTLAKGARDHPWRQWQRLQEFFKTGQVCVIDGANGTEIQRRGGRPAETFSSGTAPLARPDLCQEVHEAYLNAGADVIITHSYSANRNVMNPSGNGNRVDECIICAASIARRAVLNHVAEHASSLARTASSTASTASLSIAAASRSAARASTSSATNEGAYRSAEAALESTMLAADAINEMMHSMQEVYACAAASNAAAQVAIAASEGDPLPEAVPPVVSPPAVRTQGWDAAGFGPPLIVGSLSTHPPEMRSGVATSSDANWPPPEQEEDNYFEAAYAHRSSGIDMLWLEMMKDRDHAPRAVRAAASSGLPVFMGISARTDRETGKIVLFGDCEDAVPLTVEWFHELAEILGENMVGVNVMHTNFSTMAKVLRFVREECGWKGPLGAYPDHGTFQAPEWVFAELDTAVAVEMVQEWINDYNVQLVGGCCGLGPEFITSLSAMARAHNAGVRRRTAEHEQANTPDAATSGFNF